MENNKMTEHATIPAPHETTLTSPSPEAEPQATVVTPTETESQLQEIDLSNVGVLSKTEIDRWVSPAKQANITIAAGIIYAIPNPSQDPTEDSDEIKDVKFQLENNYGIKPDIVHSPDGHRPTVREAADQLISQLAVIEQLRRKVKSEQHRN
jgi:hypothetical protein